MFTGCTFCRERDGSDGSGRCYFCGNGKETMDNVSEGSEAFPVQGIRGFYRREEIIQRIGEDCNALSDAQLAKYATKKLEFDVIYLEGFVGLVFLAKG